MSHKVLMMGGQRSGKSTMLASIVHSQKRETSDSLFTIRDVTDYTQTIIGNDGQSYPLPALPSKIMEVSCIGKIMRILNALYKYWTAQNGKEPMSLEVFRERKEIINELPKK